MYVTFQVVRGCVGVPMSPGATQPPGFTHIALGPSQVLGSDLMSLICYKNSPQAVESYTVVLAYAAYFQTCSLQRT